MRTLNEQIQRLRDVLVTCYKAIKRKGGTIPEEGLRNMTNLPAAVLSIPQEHGVLTELEVTASGEYLPQEGVDGFSKVTARFDPSSLPKVKVASFKVTNNCINENGRWGGELLIDTSSITDFSSAFEYCSAIKNLDASSWDVSNGTNFKSLFSSCMNIETLLVRDWNVSNALIITNLFTDCRKLKSIDLRKWEVPNVYSASTFVNNCYELTSLVGDENEKSVEENGTTILKGLKVSMSLGSYTAQLNRASLRALINGLADVTDQPEESRPTLTLGTTLMAKLKDEDIAILTNKGWNLA